MWKRQAMNREKGSVSRRTLIMLSAKRCGSTAVFKMFQKHPEVGVCHANARIGNWEPNFWNMGAQAIRGHPEPFRSRFRESHPFLALPERFTEESVFGLWDDILEELGPVVFDKSPQYLGDRAAFELLGQYRRRGNDVRFFAFIRDPRDAITSQYELWRKHVRDDSLEKRELAWLEKYRHLEQLQKSFADIPLFRYEDFVAAPLCYAPMIFKHCGCTVLPETYEHIAPTSVNRYSASLLPAVRNWTFSDEFVSHLKRYGYRIPQLRLFEAAAIRARMFARNLGRRV